MSDRDEAAERRRVRELLRYYHPTVRFRGDSTSDSSQVPKVNLPHDTILTGLAQLGVYRTGCQRAYITLADQENQYILAEATRTGFLSASSRHGCDEAYLGPSIIERSRDICPGAVKILECKGDSAEECRPFMTSRKSRLVVNDMAKEEEFKDKTYVTQWPHMRFYAEVPITCFSGYVLGSYCVVDDKPREKLDDEDFAYLHDVAGAIMTHLEAIRTQNLHTRSERLIKGLGLFVEGRSSLREWWLGQSDNLNKSSTMTRAEKRQDLLDRADEDFGRPPRPDPIPQVTSKALNERRTSLTSTQDSQPDKRLGLGGTATQETDATLFTPNTEKSAFITGSNTPSHQEAQLDQDRDEAGFLGSDAEDALYPDKHKKNATPRAVMNKISVSDQIESNPQATVTEKTKSLFSRASNLIREAVELEGVVFLDASWTDPGIRGKHRGFDDAEDGDLSMSSSPSDDDGHNVSGINRQSTFSSTNTSFERPSGEDKCQVLGYSTRVKSSYAGNAVTVSTPTTDQKRLRRLLQKYPLGTLFTFDKQGVISSSDEDSEARKTGSQPQQPSKSAERRKTSRQRDGEALLRILPGARSVAFYPLWDQRKERWFAATLAWTSDETRVLEPDHMTYFAAFGNSIMAEVTRIEALAADRAKSNFIASISHELRSPLHGILGSAELLQDTEMSKGQDEMIRMIEICGRTLLDTTDHLLDFAKINHLRPNNRPGTSEDQDRAIGRTSAFNFADMVEEVVDCVFAGHTHQNSASSLFYMTEGSTKIMKSKTLKSNAKSRLGAVGNATRNAIAKTMIVVDIEKRDNWTFCSQPGAWKRVLMNLFGNALKYTQEGTILISLRCQEPLEGSLTAEKTRVSLHIHDSGQGISSEYLKHRLYTPFSQENDLSVGTGLGLSIVKQIASAMGATISLKSELGVGTQVEVSAMLEQSSRESCPPSSFQTAMTAFAAQSRERTIALVGFDLIPDLAEPVTGVMSTSQQQLLLLKNAVENLATKWLGLRVVPEASIHANSVGVLIVHESQIDVFERLEQQRVKEGHPRPLAPTLIMCSRVGRPPAPSHGRVYIHHPFTLQKIGEEISKCLRMSIVEHALPTMAISHEEENNEAQEEPSRHGRSFSMVHRDLAPNGHSRSTSRSTSSSTLPPKVLVVDDNEINLRLLAGFMKKLKYEHVTASDGQQALDAYSAASPKFSVILMDLSMPVMDGVTATREIRKIKQEEHERACKIIACTGLGSTEAREEALNSGMDMYLTKPISFRNLKQVLAEAFEGLAQEEAQ